MRGKGVDEQRLSHGLLSTWRRSDAEAPREVILQGVEHGRHVPPHLVQVDDVFHQRGVNVHFGGLTLRLGWDQATRGNENKEKNKKRRTVGYWDGWMERDRRTERERDREKELDIVR